MTVLLQPGLMSHRIPLRMHGMDGNEHPEYEGDNHERHYQKD